MEEEKLRFKLIKLVLEYDLDGPFIGGFRLADSIITKAKQLEDYITTGKLTSNAQHMLEEYNKSLFEKKSTVGDVLNKEVIC